jgi:hypothetical protein
MIMDRRFGLIGLLVLAGVANAQTTITLTPLTPLQVIGVQCGQPPVTTIATGFVGAYATTYSSSTTSCGGSGRGGGYTTHKYSGCATARYTLTGTLKDVTRGTCAAPDPGLVFGNATGYSEFTSGNRGVLGLPDVTPTYSWTGVNALSVPLGVYQEFDASIVNDSPVPLHVYSVTATSTAVSAYPVDPTQCAEVDLDPGASCAFTIGVYAGNEEFSQGTIALSAVTSSVTDSVFQQAVSITDPPPPLPACSDGIDNDGDGLVDFDGGASANGGVPIGLPDPGCAAAASTTESPQCQDGIDNDGDGNIDFDGGASANYGVALAAADPQCTAPSHNDESRAAACGLGAELVLVLPLISLVASRRRRTSQPIG